MSKNSGYSEPIYDCVKLKCDGKMLVTNSGNKIKCAKCGLILRKPVTVLPPAAELEQSYARQARIMRAKLWDEGR